MSNSNQTLAIGALAAAAPLDATNTCVRIDLSNVSAVTNDVLPAGTYAVSLAIAGVALCYFLLGAAPTAVVPTNLAAADITKANGVLDAGATITVDGTTKIAVILDANTTGKLALTRLF